MPIITHVVASVIFVAMLLGAGRAHAQTDHGSLTGLDDPEDHQWSFLHDGSRPMTGDLDFDGNDATNLGVLFGGGLSPGFLLLAPDQDTEQSTAVRGVALDFAIERIDSAIWLGMASMAFGDVVADGTSTSPIGIGYAFGAEGTSSISLENTATNAAQLFLLQHRQTYRAIDGNSQKVLASTLVDEPIFESRNIDSHLQATYGGVLSQPVFASSNGGTGTATGTEDGGGMVHFRAAVFKIDSGWQIPLRRGFLFRTASDVNGTLTDEIAIDVDDFAASGLRLSLRSVDPSGEMRHAGPASFGANAEPDTTLHVAGTEAVVTVDETSTTPPAPTADEQGRIYIKGSKLIVQWNDGGTVRYKYLDLAGTGVTWAHTTTAP